MTFPTFSKKQVSVAAVILITAIATLLLFFYLRHSPRAPKPMPVAQTPATTPAASAPASETAKINKPAAATGQGKKWPPPAKIKGKPVVIQSVGQQPKTEKTEKTNKEIVKLLRQLADRGIDVHLVGKPPDNTAETQPVCMTDEELAEAYKNAVREGRKLP